ncbi:hypothetical protein Amn_24110 [Aminobacter sp. Y103A]|nr:hypothetical protein Amn_24110 [Aminobacter sp. SS-2016]
MRSLVLLLAIFVSTTFAAAKAPQKVYCESGKWPGTSIFFKNSTPEITDDSVSLPDTLYIVSPDKGSATMTADNIETPASITNTHYSLVSVSYTYRGVYYTDTLYDDGMVISQLARISLLSEPLASTFYKRCKILG